MQEIYEKVATWNAMRYEQKYDNQVQHTLLAEEYAEWIQATDQVNDAKELLDLVYLALGGLWKLNRNDENEQVEAQDFVQYLLKQSIIPPGTFIGALLDANSITEQNQVLLMHCIIGCALAQLMIVGFTQDALYKALNILCKSNATKTVERDVLKPTKGEYFRPAEPELRKLMEDIKCLPKAH